MKRNNKKLVFFERWFDPVAEDILNARTEIDLVRLRYASAHDASWDELATAHGYQIGARTELVEPWFGNADLLARSPNLLAICSIGAGYDVIDVDACTAAGIAVCNQSGTNSEPVAEHAIAFILGLSKRVRQGNRALLNCTASDRFELVGNDIRGKTLGIVGIGQIGRLTARYAAAFGMTVLAYDPYLSAEEIAARGAGKVEFEELLVRCDFISLHCPRTNETLRMFGAEQFGKMKANAYFINTARGRLHDEQALLDALKSGGIAGAGLDVFDDEPPAPDHPLLHLDNIIATPHIAGATVESCRAMSEAAADQWITLFEGKVPPRLVNPEVWPQYSHRFESAFGIVPEAL